MASVDQQTLDRPIDVSGSRSQSQDALAQKATKFEFRRSVFVQEAPSTKKEANEYISFSAPLRQDMSRFLGRYVDNLHEEAQAPGGKERLSAQPHAQELLRVLGEKKDRIDKKKLDENIGKLLDTPEGWVLTKTLLEQETAMETFAIGLMYQAEMTKAQQEARKAGRTNLPHDAAQQAQGEAPQQTEENRSWLAKLRRKKPFEDLPKSGTTGAVEGAVVGGLATSMLTNTETYRDIAHAAANLGEWVYNLPPTMQGALLAGTTAAILGRRIAKREGPQAQQEQQKGFQQNIDTLRSIKDPKNKDYAQYIKATIGIDVDDFDIVEEAGKDPVVEIIKHPKSTTSFTDLVSGIEANIKTRDRYLQELGVPQSQRDSYPEMFIIEGEASHYERTGERVNKRILDKYQELGGTKTVDEWGNTEDSPLFKKIKKEDLESRNKDVSELMRDSNGRDQKDPLWGRRVDAALRIAQFDERRIEDYPRDQWGHDYRNPLYGKASESQVRIQTPGEPSIPLTHRSISYDSVRHVYIYREPIRRNVDVSELSFFDSEDNPITRNPDGTFIKSDGSSLDRDEVDRMIVRTRRNPHGIYYRDFTPPSGADTTFSYTEEVRRELATNELFILRDPDNPDNKTYLSTLPQDPAVIQPYRRDTDGNSPLGWHQYDNSPPRPEYAHLYGRIDPRTDNARSMTEAVSEHNFLARDKDGRAPSNAYFGTSEDVLRDLHIPLTLPAQDFATNFYDRSVNRYFAQGLDQWGQGPSSPYFCRYDGEQFRLARERSLREDSTMIAIDQWGQRRLRMTGEENPFFMKIRESELTNIGRVANEANITRFREAREFVLTDLTERAIDRIKAHPEDTESISLIDDEIKARKEGGRIYETNKKITPEAKARTEKDLENLTEEEQKFIELTQKEEASKQAALRLKQLLENNFPPEITDVATAKQKLHNATVRGEDIEIQINGHRETILSPKKRRLEAGEALSEERTRFKTENPRKPDEDKTEYTKRIEHMLADETLRFDAEIDKANQDERMLSQIHAEIDSLRAEHSTLQGETQQLTNELSQFENDFDTFITRRDTSLTSTILTDTELRDGDIDKLLTEINRLHEEGRSNGIIFGWPERENGNERNRLQVLHAIVEARARQRPNPPTQELRQQFLIDLRKEREYALEDAEEIDLSADIIKLETVKDLMQRQGTILGTRTQFMADIDTYIPVAGTISQSFEDLPYSQQQTYTEKERTYGKTKIAERERIIAEAESNFRRDMLARGANVEELRETRDKAIAEAPEFAPVAYFQLMDLLFDYQSKSGDERANAFATITDILPPSRVYEIIRDNPELPEAIRRTANLNEMMVALNREIKNGEITRVDLRRLFTGIIDNIQARALAGNLALAA